MGQYVSPVQLHKGGVHSTYRGKLTIDSDGIIAFYPMEEDGGTILYDEATRTHNGEIQGATWTDGEAGTGLFFDNDAYVEIPNSPDLDFRFGDFTCCFFLHPEEEGRILYKRTVDSGYEILLEDHTLQTIFEDGSGRQVLNSDTSLSSNEKYFIAIVRETDIAHLYIDMGLEDEGHAEYDLDNSTPLFLGDPERSFRGWVDELYFYERALSEKELKSIYEMYETI